MRDRDEELHQVAQQISRVIDPLVDALSSSIATTHASLVEHGLDPYDDPSLFSHHVRRLVRERLKVRFPSVDKTNPNMSPIHLPLGPHELRMLRARDGVLPRPQTKTRSEWFERNDKGIMALNVFPADELVTIEETAESVAEARLVLLWESEGPELTSVKLCRPSMTSWPGPSVDLYAAAVAEDDLQFERREGDQRAERTGTDDDPGREE